jgi:hypothetical protein
MIQVTIKTKEELEGLKLTELKALCKKYQFEDYSSLKKSEVVDSLLDFFSNIDTFEGFEVAKNESEIVKFHRPLNRRNPITWR